MHGKQSSRAHKRGHQNNTSSSEYSSASSSHRSAATESDKSAQNNYDEYPQNDDHPDGYPTSDDSEQHDHEQPHHEQHHQQSTARKGPMHSSYQRANRRAAPDSDGASTQSESEDDHEEQHEQHEQQQNHVYRPPRRAQRRQPRSPPQYDDDEEEAAVNEEPNHRQQYSYEHNGFAAHNPRYHRDDEPDEDDRHDGGADEDDEDDMANDSYGNYQSPNQAYPQRGRAKHYNGNSRDGSVAQSRSPSRSRSPSPHRSASPQQSASPPQYASPPRSMSPRRSRGKRLGKSSTQIAQERKSAVEELWGQYDPIVRHASDFCVNMVTEPASLAYARLVGAGKGSIDYFVRMREVTIGRAGSGADCQIRSDNRSVSRCHAKLYWDAGKDHWMITCLSEKNGMVVDGAPIDPFGTPVAVNSRSLLEIGDVAFFFLAAAETTFRVNDITILEESIYEARSKVDVLREKYDIMATKESQESARKSGRNGRLSSRADRSSAKKNKRDLTKKGKGGARRFARPGSSRKGVEDQQSDMEGSSLSESSSSESEQGEEFNFDLLDDPKYQLPLMHPAQKGKRRHERSESNGRKRRKRGKSYDEDEGSTYEEDGSEVEWTKKEKTDFTRALFAVGVDAEMDDRNNVTGFDWARFRYIADFPKKTDTMLEEYYRRVMLDVREMLDEEEREKKAKGPRTKHKPGCECNICENARKARRKRREELGVDERDGAASEEDAEARASNRSKDRLVGLVTAQKLRVRIGIHEAARQIDSEAGYNVFTKLQAQPTGEVKEMPSWWRPGHHDHELMQGCQWHGVGQWNDIWFDDNLELFLEERRDRDPVEWPTQQATMKRVRDLASSIISEMKRLRKRDALMERAKRRDERRAARRSARRRAASHKENGSTKRKRTTSSRSKNDGSGDEYDDVPETQGREDGHGDGESTVDDESGSDRGRHQGNAAQGRQDDGAATEDEEDVEMEVEEEMEIEPEYEYYDEYQGSQEREESGGEEHGNRGGGPQRHGASTEDEEEGDQGGYGTVSDSGGE